MFSIGISGVIVFGSEFVECYNFDVNKNEFGSLFDLFGKIFF